MKPIHAPHALLKPLAAAILLAGATAASSFAATVNLNSGWQFHRDDSKQLKEAGEVPAGAWSRVDVPHIARIEGREPENTWQGTAFYRRGLDVKLKAGERAILRFESAMNVADVWVNGKHLGQHLGGYLPFSFDVTDLLAKGGRNEVVVRINNEDNKITGPKPLKDLDYIQYGGIFRDVNLIIKPAVHITDEMLSNTPAGGGVFVTYPQADAASATVHVKTEVSNSASEARSVTVRQALVRGGKRVGEAVEKIQLAAGERRHVELEV
jgi:beta-galactosidase